jgi:prepilin-type N-terminal cleavage/methylation domain-containing protein
VTRYHHSTGSAELDHKDYSDDGFALVELLVALTLFALLSALLVQTLLGASQLLRVREAATAEGSVATVRQAVANLLSGARPVRWRFGNSGADTMLMGKSNSIILVTGYAAQGQNGGLYSTTLFTEGPSESNSGQSLILEQSLSRSAEVGPSQSHGLNRRTVLIDGLRSVSFKFYGQQMPRQEPGWFEIWASNAKLPERISIELAFVDPAARDWPPLVVELPLFN